MRSLAIVKRNNGVRLMDDHVRLGTLDKLIHRRDRLRERLARAWEAHRPKEFIHRIENSLWNTWRLIDEAEARDGRSRPVVTARTCPAECA